MDVYIWSGLEAGSYWEEEAELSLSTGLAADGWKCKAESYDVKKGQLQVQWLKRGTCARKDIS